MNRKSLIVGLGEILWDIYPERKTLGGAPSNVVWNAACLGQKAVLVSRVGTDALGDEAIRCLTEKGISTSHIQRDAETPTGTVHITLSDSRIPSFQCSTNAAYDQLIHDPSWDALIPEVDSVVYGTTGQRNPVAREATRYFIHRVLTGLKVYDVNFRKFDERVRTIMNDGLEAADIVKVNEEELITLYRETAPSAQNMPEFAQLMVQQYNLAVLLVTLGAKGAVAVLPHDLLYVPGYRIQPVDTTGAGDAFTTGYLIRTLEQQPPELCLAYANLLAAFHATLFSGTPEFTAEDVQAFAASHKPMNTDPVWAPWLV